MKFEVKGDVVQVVEFMIEGGILKPHELRSLSPPVVDRSKPIVLSGRGPQWLYSYLVHHYHPCKVLATYEPRLGKGIIIEAASGGLIGMAIDLSTGQLVDEHLNAKGVLAIDLTKLGGLQLVKAESRGDLLIEPSTLRAIDWEHVKGQVDPSKPIIAYIMAPIWVGAHLASQLSNLAPWYAVYDPRLEAAIVTARHIESAPKIGELVRIEPVKHGP